MEQEKYNDEIDLIEVFNNLLKSAYFFFNRWYKTLAVSIIAGIILGGGIYLKDKRTYQNTMLGYSPVINPVLIVNIINSLDKVNKDDKLSIQKILNLSPEEADRIIGFHADTVETLKNNITTISVELHYKDTLNISKFTNNLINYINNNSYVADELLLNKNRLNALIQQTEKEIIKLDSLQKALLKNATEKPGIKKGTFVISNDQIDNFYHNDILGLTAKKQKYISELEHLSGFEPISQFEPAKIKGRSLIKTVGITTGIIFGLVFFTLLILEIRRKALHLIHKK